MLSPNQKRNIKEVLKYFIETTGCSVDQYILKVQKNARKMRDDMPYSDWLAVKSYLYLLEQGVCLADFLEYRNIGLQLKNEKKGINVASVWKSVIGKLINKSGISNYTLFEMSDLNSELNYISSNGNNVDIVYGEIDKKVNYFNIFDFDKNNQTFLNILPFEIKRCILENKPLFINFNPYLEQGKKMDVLFDLMKLYGFGEKYLLNSIYGCIFRILRLCEEYELTNVKIGFFSPLNMFYEEDKYLKFYTYFRGIFNFDSGICFNPKSMGVKDKAELIGYTIWSLKKDKSEKNKRIVLQEKIQQTDDLVIDGVERLIRGKKDSLYDWTVKNTLFYGKADDLPKFLNFHLRSDEMVKRTENVLGYMLNSKNQLRSLKKLGVYSVPFGEYSEVTFENWTKMVASFAVRSCLLDKIDMSVIYLSNPDVEIEGYQTFIADAFVYFLFSPLSMQKSYREKDFVLSNRMFPLSYTDVRKYVTDENIILDMNQASVENMTVVKILSEIQNELSDAGLNLLQFCQQKIVESLLGRVRENIGYHDSLVAWDAGFYQIRNITSIFGDKDEQTYQYLVSKLKDTLSQGIYKYGFICENI